MPDLLEVRKCMKILPGDSCDLQAVSSVSNGSRTSRGGGHSGDAADL